VHGVWRNSTRKPVSISLEISSKSSTITFVRRLNDGIPEWPPYTTASGIHAEPIKNWDIQGARSAAKMTASTDKFNHVGSAAFMLRGCLELNYLHFCVHATLPRAMPKHSAGCCSSDGYSWTGSLKWFAILNKDRTSESFGAYRQPRYASHVVLFASCSEKSDWGVPISKIFSSLEKTETHY